MNVRPETIKFLGGENIGSKFLNISLRNIFVDLTLKAMERKTKINKYNYIKLMRFRTAQETVTRMNEQPIEWEKIFVNQISDKAFISKYI